MAVHPSAIVEDGATLGAGVEIGPFCHVGPNVSLGDGVRLISNCVVTGKTEIGARTVVHPQAVLGGEGQIRNNEFEGRLLIGSDCVIREGVTMSAGSKNGGGVTTVGNNGYFMAMSHVGHDCHVGNDVTLVNAALLGGHIEVGDFALIGGGAAAQQFGRIGKGSFVSGLSGVNLDIIPYGEAIGLHAKLGGLNLIGLKRRGVPRPRIHALRAAFRMIFVDGSASFADSARRAQEQWPDMDEVQEVAAFILAPAKRRIAGYRRHAADADTE